MLENTKESVKRVKSEARKWVRGSERLLFLFLVISLAKFLNIERKPKTRKKKKKRELSGSLVFRTRCFHCCGPRFDPCWGTKIPQMCMAGEKKKKERRDRERERGGREKERKGRSKKKKEREGKTGGRKKEK